MGLGKTVEVHLVQVSEIVDNLMFGNGTWIFDENRVAYESNSGRGVLLVVMAKASSFEISRIWVEHLQAKYL